MNTMPAYWETSRDELYKRVGNPKTDTGLSAVTFPGLFRG